MFIKAGFNRKNDLYERYFMTSLDCPYSINKNLYAKTCESLNCGDGAYCSMGLSAGGTYTHKFRNVDEGSHTICVWPSSPAHYEWDVTLSVAQLNAENCGDKICNQTSEDCENCVQDCGVCTSKAYKIVSFDYNKTNTWRGKHAEMRVLIPENTSVEHAFMVVKAFSNDSYFARSARVLVNKHEKVIIPFIRPYETISHAEILNASHFSTGVNLVETYLTTSNEYSADSWIEGSLKIYYNGKKPLLMIGEENVSDGNLSTKTINLFNSKTSSGNEYAIARITIPENTRVTSAVIISELENKNNVYARKAKLIVNDEEALLAEWVGPGEKVAAEKECAQYLRKGANRVSVVFEGEDDGFESSAGASINITYSGEAPQLESVKDVVKGASQLDPDDLIEREEIVVNNDYDSESLNRKISVVLNELERVENKTSGALNKSLALYDYYDEIGSAKKDLWDEVVEKLQVITSEVKNVQILVEMLREYELSVNDLKLVKQKLVVLLDHYNVVLDDVFEALKK